MKRLFVENFRATTTEQSILDLFETQGKVHSVNLHSGGAGEALGYAFVVMEDDGEADSAIGAFNQKYWNGTRLTVTQAVWAPARRRGFSGGHSALAYKQR